jgi:hypothetical protein
MCYEVTHPALRRTMSSVRRNPLPLARRGESVITPIRAHLIPDIDNERRLSEGKIPSRTQVISDLIKEAIEARQAARQASQVEDTRVLVDISS